MAFPGALPPAGTASASATLAASGHTALHNNDRDEIRAIATKIGTGSSTPVANTVLRGTASGVSAFGQVALAGEVSGVLPVANGGTGQSSGTGSGLPVFQTSPTISGAFLTSSPTLTTPTIASLTNAQHDHEDAAGGGVLGTNSLADEAITYAKLLSTIFSGQVTSYANAGTAGGTFYYLNLGGIKILYGVTGVVGTAALGVTLPASFFSSLRCIIAQANPGYVNTDQIVGHIASASTSSITVQNLIITGSNPSNSISLLVIGS